MINRTPEEEARYVSRMKFQLDEASKLDGARKDGIQEGEQKGRLKERREGQIQLIQTLQQLANIAESSAEQLRGLPEEQLIAMTEQLKQQLRTRVN